MKHLDVEDTGIPMDKILSNWANTAAFIYSDKATVADVKALLRHEVLTKNRFMIIERLLTRLTNLIKGQLKDELSRDIIELKNGI